MAAFDFPNSPSTNDTHTENGVEWVYNGYAWDRVEPSSTIVTDKIQEGDTIVEVHDTSNASGIGSVSFETNGTRRWNVTSNGHIIPASNCTYDLGNAEQKVRHLFLCDNSLKFVDSADAEHPLSVDSGRLKFAGGLLLGSAIKADATSGVVTATSFVGNGSGLTGVVASGTGLVIKDSDSTVGTAGTINFGSGLTVSPASAGIVTVTGVNPDWDATSGCLLYTSPSPRDRTRSRMPSSA